MYVRYNYKTNIVSHFLNKYEGVGHLYQNMLLNALLWELYEHLYIRISNLCL